MENMMQTRTNQKIFPSVFKLLLSYAVFFLSNLGVIIVCCLKWYWVATNCLRAPRHGLTLTQIEQMGGICPNEFVAIIIGTYALIIVIIWVKFNNVNVILLLSYGIVGSIMCAQYFLETFYTFGHLNIDHRDAELEIPKVLKGLYKNYFKGYKNRILYIGDCWKCCGIYEPADTEVDGLSKEQILSEICRGYTEGCLPQMLENDPSLQWSWVLALLICFLLFVGTRICLHILL